MYVNSLFKTAFLDINGIFFKTKRRVTLYWFLKGTTAFRIMGLDLFLGNQILVCSSIKKQANINIKDFLIDKF